MSSPLFFVKSNLCIVICIQKSYEYIVNDRHVSYFKKSDNADYDPYTDEL